MSGRVVWKYPVPQPTSTARAFIDLPYDEDAEPEFLSAGFQDDEMFVWALVNPDNAAAMRRLIVVNTGQGVDMPHGARFLATVTSSTGVVWHVFDGDAETTA